MSAKRETWEALALLLALGDETAWAAARATVAEACGLALLDEAVGWLPLASYLDFKGRWWSFPAETVRARLID